MEDGGLAVVQVVDHGPGLPVEEWERIFEPFQRGAPGDAAGEGHDERKGLGLYIARRMAEAHGGALGVESSREEGTTFSIRLPRDSTSEPSD